MEKIQGQLLPVRFIGQHAQECCKSFGGGRKRATILELVQAVIELHRQVQARGQLLGKLFIGSQQHDLINISFCQLVVHRHDRATDFSHEQRKVNAVAGGLVPHHHFIILDVKIAALFTVLGKFPELQGVLGYWAGRLSGKRRRLIEYK